MITRKVMKFSIVFVCLTFFFVTDLYAGQIEELEKRIDLLEQSLKDKKNLAGFEDGDFFISSSDGNYRITPSIALQFQYRRQNIDNSDNTSDFFLRRGRVKLEGNLISEQLEYEVEFDVGTPDPGDSQFDLKDFYFDYNFRESFRFKGGQFKVPFGFQELTSSKKQQFVDRSLASEEFVAGRDVGVMLWGPEEGAFLEYYVGVFNGEGDNNFNENNESMYAARIVLNPFGKYKEDESDLKGSDKVRMSFGVEAFQNKDVTSGDDILVTGGFFGVKHSGFSLRAEYFNRSNDDDLSTDAEDLDAHGFYGQIGYFLIPKRFEVALRSSQISREGANNDENEYSVAINYFIKGQNAKVQADYTRLIDEDAIVGPNDETRNLVRTQIQFYF